MNAKQKNIAIAIICAALIVFVAGTSGLSVSQLATAGMVVLIPIAVGGAAGIFGLVPFVKSADERARERERKGKNDQ